MSLARYIILGLLVFSIFRCHDKIIEPSLSGLRLTAEDVGITDVFIRVNVKSDGDPWKLKLMRDRETIYRLESSDEIMVDTIIIDQNLEPNRKYSYRAYLYLRSSLIKSSKILIVITGDTTSHYFEWDVFQMGMGYSPGWSDVAIINDSCIWVVGEINVLDSLGEIQNPPYNIARWNGISWAFTTTKDSGYGYGENYSIFAFNDCDLWVGGSIPKHWDGQKWTFHGSTKGYAGGFGIKAIWGRSSHDLYVVGDYGNIRHFDGTRWQKIESGTTQHIKDIWGSVDEMTGELEIIAVAASADYFERAILKISGTSVMALSDSGINLPLKGVWFISGRKYYLSGGSVYTKSRTLDVFSWVRESSVDYSYRWKNSIRGDGLNNIAIACDEGDILHYNGYSWRSYFQQTSLGSGLYERIAIHGDIIAAVGKDVIGRGVVAIGKR